MQFMSMTVTNSQAGEDDEAPSPPGNYFKIRAGSPRGFENNGDLVIILSKSSENRHKFDTDIDKICEYIGNIELLCIIRQFIAFRHFQVL